MACSNAAQWWVFCLVDGYFNSITGPMKIFQVNNCRVLLVVGGDDETSLYPPTAQAVTRVRPCESSELQDGRTSDAADASYFYISKFQINNCRWVTKVR